MKKKLIIFFAVLLIIGFVVDFFSNFSIVTAGKVQPVTYVTLKWGNGYNEVGLKGPYEDFWYDGPATFDVDKEGNIYVVDQLNNRIIKVDKSGKVIDSIDISKIISNNDPNAKYGPIQLIVADKCMFLLHVYSFDLPPPDPYSYPPRYGSLYVSIITKEKIIKIDAQKLLGQPIYVMMDRLNGNRVVLTPSIPPEDLPTWKGPKAVIVNEKGEIQIVKELVNESFDGTTPFASLLFSEDKDTHFYRNVRIQVKDPQANKVIFTSSLIENGAPITYSLGLNFNGDKAVFMYQSTDTYNEENNTVTTHISIFTLSPRKEEHYIMVAGDEDRKDMLPPPFTYKVDFVLGQDGYFYRMIYMKDELQIQRFEPEVTQTEYFYRSHKL